MNDNRKKNENKNIFSGARIMRLFFTAWVVSFALTLVVIMILRSAKSDFLDLREFVLTLIFMCASTLVCAIIFSFLVKNTNYLTSSMNDAINRISGGDFSARLNVPPMNSDIDSVVENFNKMAEELNSLAILNKDFVSNFSHEFKTPIVSVKGYAELLENSPNLSEEERRYVNIIVEESDRLCSLSDSAMTISKLDSNQIDSQKKPFWLDEELAQCILLFDSRLSQKNLELVTDIDRIRIVADKKLTKEIWINLLSNAVKFTPENGSVTLTAKEHGDFAFITVSDTGIGFDETTADKLFERHYQAETKQKTQGNGIGLAIAKRIVELHGGNIRAEKSPSGGAQFVVKLPLN